ncbi:MAG: HypC/HybG/HupF family hydrogenase formation chaperone [Lacisediminihabitans sp.]
MCLAIPGRITEVWQDGGAIFATADFAGETRKVCLNFLPDLAVGDSVIVHAGYALSKINQEQVDQVMDSMREAGLIDDATPTGTAAETENMLANV